MRRTVVFALFLTATSGCDRVFGLVGGDGNDMGSGGDAAMGSDGHSMGGDGGIVCTGPGPDEDGDGLPNSCDPCPGNPVGGMNDSDGDGIGDLCDPNPASACETRLLFAGFDGASNDVNIGADPWSYDAEGNLVIDGVGPQRALAILGGAISGSVQVRASVHIEKSSGSNPAVGIASNVRVVSSEDQSGFVCEYLPPAMSTDAIEIETMTNSSPLAFADAENQAPLEAELVLVSRASTIDNSVDLTCDVFGADGHASLSSPPIVATDSTDVNIAVASRETMARFHWVDVLQLDGACQ